MWRRVLLKRSTNPSDCGWYGVGCCFRYSEQFKLLFETPLVQMQFLREQKHCSGFLIRHSICFGPVSERVCDHQYVAVSWWWFWKWSDYIHGHSFLRNQGSVCTNPFLEMPWPVEMFFQSLFYSRRPPIASSWRSLRMSSRKLLGITCSRCEFPTGPWNWQ